MWYDSGMKILAIESSCDETACAILEGREPRPRILSNVVVSQIDIFAEYGGVIPEVAARSHLEAILPVVHKALTDANCTKDDIDVIAVTFAPGLLGSLLIGTLTARMLAILWQKPLYAVHHLKSHIYSNWLEDLPATPKFFSDRVSSQPVFTGAKHPTLSAAASESSSKSSVVTDKASTDYVDMPSHGDLESTLPEFPLLALVVSGGHTQIIYMRAHNEFEIIGTTRDDAVGECFDKVAKVLGLPYPGGPAITAAALSLTETGNYSGVNKPNYSDMHNPYHLPIPQVEGLDFSFSGLKTAVLRAVQNLLGLPITTPSFELAEKLTDEQRANFAASFQQTVVEILLRKLQQALELHPDVKSVVLAGGVSANQELRERAFEFGERNNVAVYYPELKYAGDNAAMVGAAAYYEILSGVKPVDPYDLDIMPRTPIK